MEATARQLAKYLLDIHAVLLRTSEPFVWASGWHSPIYCDNRRILSSPEIRSQVSGWLAERVMSLYPEAETVAGVATGAIAHGILVADRMSKPFVYVRTKAKDHGTGSRIEGILEAGKKVVVIEDLVSTGMSSLAAVDALRKAGAVVLGMVAIFSYCFPIAAQRFAGEEVRLDTLSDYDSLVGVASEMGYISDQDRNTLLQWRLSPDTWGR